MSNELHVGAYADTFKSFPSASFAIVLANAPSKLAPPDARDRNRVVAVVEELTDHRIGQLHEAVAEVGRVVLLFATWPLFNATLRRFRSA